MGHQFINLILIFVFFAIQTADAGETPHKVLTLPCESCHVTKNWQDISFDHTTTGYELSGEHKKIACASCHNLADFSQVQANCNSCHTDVHRNRLYPDCERCHTTQSWIVMDVQKAHGNTSFQLIGRHANLDCWTCHRGEIEGEWRRLSSNCIECHRNDYLAATDPVHDDLGFGVLCEDCHSLFSWKPATFKKHDSQYFPIFSGEHAGRWESCTTCHYDAGNYSAFSCFLNCHEHNQAATDREHDDVAGYRYDSNACYECHRSGKGDD
ncbi:hypothetical protein [Caldithrix abyssi]